MARRVLQQAMEKEIQVETAISNIQSLTSIHTTVVSAVGGLSAITHQEFPQ